MNAWFKAVQLKKQQRVRWMQEATLERWPCGGDLDARIREYAEKVGRLGTSCWTEGEARTQAAAEGDALMKTSVRAGVGRSAG
jgi:hypothetical protein